LESYAASSGITVSTFRTIV